MNQYVLVHLITLNMTFECPFRLIISTPSSPIIVRSFESREKEREKGIVQGREKK